MDDYQGHRFEEADFNGARFHGVGFANVTITDAFVFNTEISGFIGSLKVNGVEVGPYVEAELNQRHPERALLAPFDADGMRTAWVTIEEFAAATLERARKLPEAKLNERVDGEWSYIETLRHLVFATDRWITGPVLKEPDPFHRLGLPNPPHDETTRAQFDVDAQPSLDKVLEVRRGRMDRVAALVRDLNATDLNRQVPNPNGGTTGVMNCLHVILREEWWHDQYANRDLAALEQR